MVNLGFIFKESNKKEEEIKIEITDTGINFQKRFIDSNVSDEDIDFLNNFFSSEKNKTFDLLSQKQKNELTNDLIKILIQKNLINLDTINQNIGIIESNLKYENELLKKQINKILEILKLTVDIDALYYKSTLQNDFAQPRSSLAENIYKKDEMINLFNPMG